MSLFDALTSQELAEQLRRPAGATGVAIAETLGAINRNGNSGVVAALALASWDHVLEVGCGLGSMAPEIVDAAGDIQYVGLDQSPTMIEAARDRHAALVRDRRAAFHLAHVEQMPFEAATFNKVFAVGVMHFWSDPIRALTEIRRVMRPNAVLAMGGLGPERAPPFARREHGFYLHDAAEWRSFCQSTGFEMVEVQSLGTNDGPQTVLVVARKR